MTDPELPLGDVGDRRQDVWSRERITAVLQASIEDRRHLNSHLRWVERSVALIGLVVIVVAVAITGIPLTGFDGLIGANSDRVEEIQQERAANIVRGCRDQNKRHDDTVMQLDALLTIAKLSVAGEPGRAEQIEQSRDFTVALIDALAPVRDCQAVIEQQIPSGSQP